MDIRICGRGIDLTDGLRDCVNEKLTDALKVFDIEPMDAEVVLRVDKNRSNPLSDTCEITVRVPKSVVRVAETDSDMYNAIDVACAKVSRQLRKYKTKLIDKRKRDNRDRSRTKLAKMSYDELEAARDTVEDLDDELVREKFVDVRAMSIDDAIVQCDLLGHDFYLFEDIHTGEANVVYRRESGGYGVLKPSV